MSDKKTNVFLTIGLAGSGKSSLTSKLYNWISSKNLVIDPETGLNKNVYSVNLDPAVVYTSMPLNYDIRQSIDYDSVMEKYKLGPNGGIITCLNIFCTRIAECFSDINAENIIIDTPGQIETFSTSTAGEIIVNVLKTEKYKLNLLFVIDGGLINEPAAFMTNMFYAASLKCKFDVEIVCVINKIDLLKERKYLKWIENYENFVADLDKESDDFNYLSSMALYFENVVKNLKIVEISAKTGEKKEEFLNFFNIN